MWAAECNKEANYMLHQHNIHSRSVLPDGKNMGFLPQSLLPHLDFTFYCCGLGFPKVDQVVEAKAIHFEVRCISIRARSLAKLSASKLGGREKGNN